MEGEVVRCSLVFGGYTLSRDDADANNLNDLWTYDFKSNVWQQVHPRNRPRLPLALIHPRRLHFPSSHRIPVATGASEQTKWRQL